MADYEIGVAVQVEDSELNNLESKLEALEDKKVKIGVELDTGKNLQQSIKRGVKAVDTSSLAKQLAAGFNLNKNTVSKLKKQMDSMVKDLAATWDGQKFDFSNVPGFYSGIDSMAETVSRNAKIIQDKMGIYDQFYSYFKDKKIYISDALKSAMGDDLYKEISNANIGKIVRDATKGISIDSIWGEMTSQFPEHFSADITNQVDQIVRAFDVLRSARSDVAKTLSFDDLSQEQKIDFSDNIYSKIIDASHSMKESLERNITSAAESLRTEFEIDVKVNTESVVSDIKSALSSGEPIKINLDLNKSEIENQVRNAIQGISANNNPLDIKIDINRQSLESDIQAALNDIDLPVRFRVDTSDIETQIRSAVAAIDDIEINVRVNMDNFRQQLDTEIPVPHADNLYNVLGNINAAGVHGQSVFQQFGSTLQEAFATFTVANLLEDAIYKVMDVGRDALSTVKELNDATVDLQMATGDSYGNVRNMLSDYNALGQELGALTTEVSESADAWLRQGKTQQETNALIKDSMVLSKVGQLSSSDSTEYLTSAMQGYKVAVEDVSKITDKLTAIDLVSATDAGGLAEAMSRTAESANIAGVSMDRLLAMLATTGEVTQRSMSSIGESYKTIFARMRDIKANKLSSVGDDGEIEDISQVEEVLGTLGIKLRDSNLEFRNFQTVLDEVAASWDSYSSVQQAAVAKAFAGARQQENFLVMMENYDKVLKYTDVAANSEGSALEKFGYYSDSLEAKTKSLQASLEALAANTIPEGLYAGFLDGAKALTDMVTQTNLLKGALAGLGTGGALFAFQSLGTWLSGAVQEFSNLTAALDMVRNVEVFDSSGMQDLINLTQGLTQSQLELVLSSESLSVAQRMAILQSTGLSQAEAQAALSAMGLSAANGAATGATVTLSGALRGLWATLMANPLILVAAGVTAAVAAFSSYKKSVEEAVSSAKKAGTAWEEQNTSLEDNISRITELRTALASGTLSEEEAYQAKSELLSIQQSLTESYGEQAQGIDLLNGSLDEQIAKVKELSVAQGEQFLNENQKGINKAVKEMEKSRHTYLGQFYKNGSEEYDAIVSSVKKINDKYGEELFTLDEHSDGVTVDLHFNGDATEAKSALNDFMSDMRDAQSQIGESDLLSGLSDSASYGLKEANEILEEYQDLYNQAMKAELFTDKKDYGGKTAADWLNNYSKAVEKYNDALSSGDFSKIAEAKEHYKGINDSIQMLLSNSDMSHYAEQFTEIGNQLNTAAIKANEFNTALSGEGTNGYQKHLKSIVDEIKELNFDDVDFKAAISSGDIDSVNYLSQAAQEAGISTESLTASLIELGVISGEPASGIEETTASIEDLTGKSTTLLSQIDAVKSALDAQSTGKSIDIDAFNSDELKDYQSALEYVNGSMQINADRAREIAKAKAEEQIATNDANKAQQQSKYMDNIRDIEQLQDELRSLTDAKGKNAEAIQSSIDALLSENDSIVNQCSQLDILSASLREATGAYQNWLDKQSGSESGDMFDDALGAIKHINDVTQNKDSDDYGRIGKESYKAAVEFIIPDTIDSQDANAVSSYIDSIEHYFNHDSDGNRTGLDVAEFCAKATEQGLMVLDEASGEYKVAGQRTMQDFAEGLNLSLPMVQAMFGEMEEFGAEFSWADEAVRTLGDLGMAAGEAKGRIESIEGNQDLNIQIDVSDIESTEDKISTLESTVSQMQDYKATLPVDSSQIDDANAVIQYCITQKQMLEAPAVMSVDASQVSGELGNALSLLQQFQTAQNNVELLTSVGADTSEAQAQVDGLVGEIQGLSPEIQAKLNIDSTSIDTITASMQGLTPELMVKAGVDSSVVDAYAAEEKQSEGTVTWGNNTSAVDAWASQMHKSNGIVSWGNDISQVKTAFTATGTVNWTNTTPPSGGTGGFNGTAHYPHLVGHANAQGNWGTKTGGVSLVGELGREIVVEPNGVWHTVGDNGAEFQYIPKGSIVFNHLQTESLLERGFVNGRGKAYASGTAMVTGGISVNQANVASGKTTYKSTASATSSNTAKNVEKASSSLQSAAKSTEKAGEALENAVKKFVDNAKDWIEISIDRIERTIQKYKDIAESRGTLTSTKKYLNLAIKETNKEIKTQEKAKARYTKQANDVAAAVGLSDSLKKKVQNGTIDISTLSEDDKKRVDAYQQWYEKILDCDDAIRQLNKDVEALAKQKVDSIVEIFDSHIGKKDAKQQYYESIQNWRETAGYSENVGSEYYDAIKKQLSLEKQKQPLIEDEIRQYKAQMKAYAKNKGTNKFNANTYREMESTLMELEASYYDNKTAIAEFEQALYDTKEQVKQWRVDTAVRAGAKQDAVINYKDVADNYTLSEKDYTERIKTVSEQIERLSALRAEKYAEMLKYGINSPKYQELASEIADIDEEVINLGSDIEEFKNKIMELRWKPFYEAQEALSNVISEYEDLRNLLGDDESFFHDDGSFSTNGLTNILLLQESVDASKQKIANYRKQLENLEEQYKNGCFSVEEYKEKTQELIDGIRDSAQAVAAYEQQMLDMYETQITMENDLLQKNIDKRLEALKAKEDYYNYDKTLKKKSKDINALKAQIAALEGTSNAAAAARLERLKAELAEAEEDMEDTVHQHQTEMKEAGFEEFQDNANAALENTTNALRTNTEFQKSVIQSMLDTVTAGYDSTYSHLNSLIEQHGIVVSETYEKMLTSVASFNTGAANLTLPDASVSGSDNSPVYTGSQSSKDTVDSTVKDNETSAGAMEEHEAKKLTIDKTSMTLYIGDTGTITATVTPKDIPVTWTSSSTSVATVSKGKVKAKKKGSTTIEAKAGSLTKKCKVTVKDISDELVEQIGQGSTSSTGTTSSSKPTTNTSGGDGKAKVGDTCTFNSGKYYAASDGSGASGTQYLGKKVKITKINSASWATHPYLIKSADGKTDLGWVKLTQLKGYAKGGVVGKKGYMPVDMNSVLGKAVISNGDSGLIGINPGETVLTEKFTELLKPSVAAMENFTRVYPQLSNPDVASSEQNLSFYNETHIHVDQAVTKEDIKAMGNYITDIVTKNFVRDMKKYR